ncbi:MAG: hypothetical protein P3X24_010130 [bacterium]|nr:hypothetical protein [bacterium]
MRGWLWIVWCALLLGQTPAVGWRVAFSKSRCDVAVCQCRDCAGGANCCCAKARTPLEQAIARSHCDRAEQEQLALTVLPRVIFTPPLAIAAPRYMFVIIHRVSPRWVSQTLVPRSPPPRSSFRLG